MIDDEQLWRLLRSLDDPDHVEQPAGYDRLQARTRLEQLTQRLDAGFHARCDVDRGIQDASLYARIVIPAANTATGHPLVILISNFGGLAVLAVDNPGAWTDVQAAELLHPDDAHLTSTALADLGYALIPEEPLWRQYDGACDPDVLLPAEPTWWDRYFDYL